mgnify:CR=1 FL=1
MIQGIRAGNASKNLASYNNGTPEEFKINEEEMRKFEEQRSISQAEFL